MKNLVKQNHFEEPGLNGFFGWLRRTVNNVINAVKEVSHNPFAFAFATLVDAFDGGGFHLGNNTPGEFLFRAGGNQGANLNTQEVELTLQEEQLLDNWVETRFKPLFISYFSQMKTFSLTPPKLNEFKVFYNNVYEFIGFINWSINNVTGHNSHRFLSANAITARNRFLAIQMELLEADIISYIQATKLNFSHSTTQLNIKTSKYQVLDFKVNDTVKIQSKKFNDDVVVGTVTNQPIGNEPTTTQPIGNDTVTVKPISNETVITYHGQQPKKAKTGVMTAIKAIAAGAILHRLLK